MMTKIHPIVWILSGLLIVSVLTNYIQILQVQRLEKEVAPIIIRPNIRLYEKPLDNIQV